MPADRGRTNRYASKSSHWCGQLPEHQALICDLTELARGRADSRTAKRVGRSAGRWPSGCRLDPRDRVFPFGAYTIIPDIAIASRGPVLSVTLFSRIPCPDIRRLALDVGSRTSAALTQILLRKRYGATPQLQPLEWEQKPEELDVDAVLLIGDRAMHACLPGFPIALDLGQEWFEWTGLPFVYAFWAVRPGAALGTIADALQQAKARGCAPTGQIPHDEGPRLGLDAGLPALPGEYSSL